MLKYRLADSAVALVIDLGRSALLSRRIMQEDLKSTFSEKMKPAEVPEEHVEF